MRRYWAPNTCINESCEGWSFSSFELLCRPHYFEKYPGKHYRHLQTIRKSHVQKVNELNEEIRIDGIFREGNSERLLKDVNNVVKEINKIDKEIKKLETEANG